MKAPISRAVYLVKWLRSGYNLVSTKINHYSTLFNSSETVFALSSGHGKCGRFLSLYIYILFAISKVYVVAAIIFRCSCYKSNRSKCSGGKTGRLLIIVSHLINSS